MAHGVVTRARRPDHEAPFDLDPARVGTGRVHLERLVPACLIERNDSDSIRTLPVYERGGTIFFVGEDGSPVALTRGFLPKSSPDGTTIAFLRDPADPHYHGGGDRFVLQVWLIHPDVVRA